MPCYRDRTYCIATDCAKFNRCDRAATPAVERAAAMSGLAMSVVERMECFEPVDGRLSDEEGES